MSNYNPYDESLSTAEIYAQLVASRVAKHVCSYSESLRVCAATFCLKCGEEIRSVDEEVL